MADRELVNRLEQEFNRFAQEERASSYAVENLMHKVLRIVREEVPQENNTQPQQAEAEVAPATNGQGEG